MPEPVVLISQRSLSDVNAVEEMEVEYNMLMIPPELANDVMSNIQLIHEMDRAMNSRSKDLLIDEEEQEMLDDEDKDMSEIEPEEVQEGEEEEDRASSDCRIISSSDSESLISEQSIVDGSRKARQRRGSAASQTTVNAPGSSLSIIINEKERKRQGMFDVGDSDNREPRRWQAEEKTEKSEHRSRHCSYRHGLEFEECRYES